MNEDTWLRIDRSGFFPRENESESEFLLSYHELFHSFPQRQMAKCPWLITANRRFLEVFHAVACWTSPSLGTKGLSPWELAACWQFSDGRSEIQVRPKLLEKNEGERNAILFHELIHASRARLQSLCFEEILAYEAMRHVKETSLFSLRCFLSRLFLTQSDILVAFVWHLALLFLSVFTSFSTIAYLSLVVLFWTFATIRACWLFSLWKKAFSNIEQAFPSKAWLFFLRASDSDIFWVSSLKSKEVFDSIMEKASYDWRWKYFVVCSFS